MQRFNGRGERGVAPDPPPAKVQVQSLLAVASKHGKGSFHGAAEEKAGKPVHERELIHGQEA